MNGKIETRTFQEWANAANVINRNFLPASIFGWWKPDDVLEFLSESRLSNQLDQLNRYLDWFKVPLITKRKDLADENKYWLDGLVFLMRKNHPEFSENVYSAKYDDLRAFVQMNYAPSFNPVEEFGWWTDDILNMSMQSIFYIMEKNLSVLNGYILDFNLALQEEFKSKGHNELYLMDDTQRMKPDEEDKSVSSEKTYLHSLNGWKDIQRNETTPDGYVNSSQLNVLFPFKKTTNKSLYASQLKVTSAIDIDDILERSRNITLQGKVSYEKCV